MLKVLYIGPFILEELVARRGLPARNPSCSMRMARLAGSLGAAGREVVILSAGIMARVRRRTPPYLPPVQAEAHGARVQFAAALALPFVGYLLSPGFLLHALVTEVRRRRPDVVFFYNFDPATLLAAAYSKWVLGLPVHLELEDVPLGAKSLLMGSDEVQPEREVFNVWFYRAAVALADGAVVPTRQFIGSLPKSRPSLVVAGACEVPARPEVREAGPLRVLFSGKLEDQHGIAALMGAVRRLSEEGRRRDFSFSVCGRGPRTRELEAFAAEIADPDFFRFVGFASDAAYAALLRQADVGLALQDPRGFYGQTKTPSKAFEFVGYGKVLIATRVGDLPSLPAEFVRICDPLGADTLHAILVELQGSGPEALLRFRQAASEHAANTFSPERVGERLGKFLEPKSAHAVV